MDFNQMPNEFIREHHNLEAKIKALHASLGPFKSVLILSQFAQLESLEEKFFFIWNLPELPLLFPPNFRQAAVFEKSEEYADVLQQMGNQAYKDKDLDAALGHYIAAITMAPHPISPIARNEAASSGKDEEAGNKHYRTLAISYANRSVVFLRKREYEKCLADIDLALECDYSGLLKKNLEERKEKCLKALAQQGKANSYHNTKPHCKVPVLDDPNETIPSLSSAVKFAYSKAKGRHLVASRDIRIGEIIAAEKSVCSLAHYNFGSGFCITCLRTCKDAPVSCPDCPMMFCSKSCRTAGLQEHAQICRVLPVIRTLHKECSYAYLAVKILFHLPFDELRQLFHELKKEAKELPPERLGFNEKGVYISDFRAIFHMESVSHLHREKDLYLMCFNTAVLTKMICEIDGLAPSGWNRPRNLTTQDCITIGTIILHIMVNQPVDFRLTKPMTLPSMEPSAFAGYGLYPAISLMLHACNSPTVVYNVGHVLIVRAVRPITAGSQITLSSGPRFEAHSKESRKKHLDILKITCSCEACEEDWPVMADHLAVNVFKCINCSEPLKQNTCPECDIDYEEVVNEGEKKSLLMKWKSHKHLFLQAQERFAISAEKIASQQFVTKDDFEAVIRFASVAENCMQYPSNMFHVIRTIMILYFYNEHKQM